MDQCGVQCLEADVMDRHTLHEPLDGVDVVYSIAFPPPGSAQEDYTRFNRVGLANLLEEAHEHGTKTFVHLSTLDVYGFGSGRTVGKERVPSPTDEYQRAKLEGERMVTEFGKAHPQLQVRIVRAAKAVGSRDLTIITPILKMMERGKVTLPSGSSAKMSFTHPKDVSQALFKAAGSVGDWTPYQVKSFDLSVAELARALVSAGGKDVDVKQQGVFSGRGLIAQYPSEEIKAGLTLAEEDSAKKLAYSPAFSLEKVVTEVSAWYRKEPWVTRSPE
jgi:nucleoside-diphosphate-sugar epimerase